MARQILKIKLWNFKVWNFMISRFTLPDIENESLEIQDLECQILKIETLNFMEKVNTWILRIRSAKYWKLKKFKIQNFAWQILSMLKSFCSRSIDWIFCAFEEKYMIKALLWGTPPLPNIQTVAAWWWKTAERNKGQRARAASLPNFFVRHSAMRPN